jgi:hypothetical protein
MEELKIREAPIHGDGASPWHEQYRLEAMKLHRTTNSGRNLKLPIDALQHYC